MPERHILTLLLEASVAVSATVDQIQNEHHIGITRRRSLFDVILFQVAVTVVFVRKACAKGKVGEYRYQSSSNSTALAAKSTLCPVFHACVPHSTKDCIKEYGEARWNTGELVLRAAILCEGHHVVVDLSCHAVANAVGAEGLKPMGKNGRLVVEAPVHKRSSDCGGQVSKH